jgi:hypothetical protein
VRICMFCHSTFASTACCKDFCEATGAHALQWDQGCQRGCHLFHVQLFALVLWGNCGNVRSQYVGTTEWGWSQSIIYVHIICILYLIYT